nr:porin family protein [Allomuricauda sp.]
MRTMNKILGGILCIGMASLNTGCEIFYKSLYVEGGPNVANQVVKSRYSPDEASIAEVKAQRPTNALIQKDGLNDSNPESSSLAASGLFGGDSQDAIPGFFIGAGVTTPINSNLSARSGLRFSTKGSETDISGIGSNKTRLSYIDVPVQLQYLIKSKFAVQMGLQPSFLLDAEMESEVNGETVRSDAKDIYKGFDLALTLGAGYNFNNGLSIQLGYDHGFINVDEQSSYRDVNNRVLRLGLLYTLKNW